MTLEERLAEHAARRAVISKRSREKALLVPGRRELTNAKSRVVKLRVRSTPEGAKAHSDATIRWQQAHPEKHAASFARYHAAKLQRVPGWANLDAIKAYYEAASCFGFAVDHIIPLRGKLVSGLHVENNLQFLTKSENSRKHNHFEVFQ